MDIRTFVESLLKMNAVAASLAILTGVTAIVTAVKGFYDALKSRLEYRKLVAEGKQAEADADAKRLVLVSGMDYPRLHGQRTGRLARPALLAISVLTSVGATWWLTWSNVRAAAEYEKDNLMLTAVEQEAKAQIQLIAVEMERTKAQAAKEKAEAELRALKAGCPGT